MSSIPYEDITPLTNNLRNLKRKEVEAIRISILTTRNVVEAMGKVTKRVVDLKNDIDLDDLDRMLTACKFALEIMP